MQDELELILILTEKKTFRINNLCLSEIPCRVSDIARGGGNTVPFNRLKSVKPYRRFMQVRRG
jgi:hypothetical protein